MTVEKIIDAIRDQQAIPDEGALLQIEEMINELISQYESYG